MKTPRATLRLQFHKDFTFDAAIDLVPYARSLGITHLYASPITRARPGSMHGYDVIDPTVVNEELGGEEGLRRLVACLRAHDMGLIIDIVPNHMGVGADNVWWQDVLEWGRSSPYADFFDIDWDPPDATLRGRMLAPVLGTDYGAVLASGDLKLVFDRAQGRFIATYFDNRFPIAPRDYPSILLGEAGPLEDAARRLADLPSGRAGRGVFKEVRAELQREENQASIGEALRLYDAGDAAGRERLHRLLERQNYRLAWWRAASDEINWRRFFDITGLAGLRVELAHVFDAVHELPLRLYAEGLVDGLRVDHVDGLADPRSYCRKLRRRLEAEAPSRPMARQQVPAILWIEKILAPHERLATDWLVDGTTGYDFMNEVSGVLHDPAGEAPLSHLWETLSGRTPDFEEEARHARRHILSTALSSEFYATAVALHRIARRDLSTRDFTLTAISHVLLEILVHFRVYRIYAGRGGMSDADRPAMDWALAGARRAVRPLNRELVDVVARWLTGDDLRLVPAGTRRSERLRAMIRFQQLSAPTAAKSVEDTAFYRYGRLISRNEVGSEPSQFAVLPSGFHGSMRDRAKRLPRALLATATHDHKRGEDSRARLAVLSECPDLWEPTLARWMRLNAPLKRDVDGPAPDATDELFIYQSIVGAWPLGLSPDDEAGMEAFAERLSGWLEKALREGKRRSSWAAPNEPYEAAAQAFLRATLDASRPTRVVHDIAACVEQIAAAGALNGLTQTLLRLTAPGIPDLYQGCEFWDLSLVDPDNRRPVDFTARAQSLGEGGDLVTRLASWRDGRIKQALIAMALRHRAAHEAVYAAGTYTALSVEGPAANHILAFARTRGQHAMIVLAPRLPLALMRRAGNTELPHVPASEWEGTVVALPRSLSGRKWHSVLGASPDRGTADGLDVAAWLGQVPVALLEAR